ncbi:PQQ-dependent sugar dehydrogenase [Nitratireductor basaltis]|uniref:Glucose sorbosone dehydrogenase n=1 Tax=Nitratireductor basaltis TaxID=472175 RepID=A0A084UCY2_9HYPH|nr:PQQ-dependent sugar dehydrogenase [Nitratireductor basaltis]KFB10818.1 Glucose sorbosone dehydrogenase precursor [Nitratireductor basaltis]
MRPTILHWTFTTSALAALVSPLMAQALPQQVEAEDYTLVVETVAEGLSSPWGATFLPDGAMLVTERTGTLQRIDPSTGDATLVEGTPEVFARGQGGLLDVELHPQFSDNRLVYLTFAQPREGGAATAAGRGRLSDDGNRLENFEVIFQQEPAVSGGNHFGSRLAFSPDGKLFVTLADRFNHMDEAQNPANHLGTVVRLNDDGSVPGDNPFAGGNEGAPEVWSYGHRNIQGAAIHPASGALWISEFGPRGGDEVNIPEAGANYGWPLVSTGRHYSGRSIPDPSSKPELKQAAYSWNPVISPSGIAFVPGGPLEAWEGDLLLAGLSSQAITRLDLQGSMIRGEERIEMGARIRDVLFDAGGTLFALTDGQGGAVIRLTPSQGR